MWREKRRKCKGTLAYEIDANGGQEVGINSDGSQGKVAVPWCRESEEWINLTDGRRDRPDSLIHDASVPVQAADCPAAP